MNEKRTVLLLHETPDGLSHWDWMIEPPHEATMAGEDERVLLTWRAGCPPWRWASEGRVKLAELGMHRRAYLTFEGGIGGGRGRVRRTDAGVVRFIEWSAEGGDLDVSLRFFRGRVSVRRVEGSRWEMRVTG